VEGLLAKSEGGQGMESSTIREPLRRHDHGGLNRQRRRASKHITGEGADAEAQVMSSE